MGSKKAFDIMVAGHLCLDIIPRFPDTGLRRIGDLLQPGKLVNMEQLAISTGGPVSNTGRNLERLGNRVCFSACVGDDTVGRMTADILRQSGNAEGVRLLEGQSSSYTVALAPPGIDRIFLHHPGTNDIFSSEDLSPELIGQCRHFHFGYPPLMERMYSQNGEDLARVFRLARETGAVTSCDMTLPDPASASGQVDWPGILARTLPHVDIHLPSVEETYFMLHREEFIERKERHGGEELIDHFAPSEYSALAGEILELGAPMTALKSGHRGFYFRSAGLERLEPLRGRLALEPEALADRELWAPAFEVEHFGSATGSGDSSIAGFLSSLIRGQSLERAMQFAVCLGYQNVQVLDAVSGIGSWEDSEAILKRAPKVIDPRLEVSEFRWSEEAGLYLGPHDRNYPG